MEFKVFLIGTRLYDLDDAPGYTGYIFGTVEDAEAYCAERNKDIEEAWEEYEWEEIDCLNPEKLASLLNQGQCPA